ncbi:protein TALPID3 isoform X2 [Siniperca chuatsi]|uniref:protein TALPID3 isoform X2 n=1 Tax=Siniperca chuatsi TaxID=119488 RepID=UPI001CE1FCEF|nr:protein TALPID3 isoform X2 [Siniperca chuatsi]
MSPPPDLSTEVSPDRSSCSSDTGDVLIRSTRVLFSDRRPEAGPGPGSVQIRVQKLRDPPVQPRQKPDKAPPLRAAARSQPDRPTLKKPGPTRETQPAAAERSPDRRLCAGPQSDRPPVKSGESRCCQCEQTERKQQVNPEADPAPCLHHHSGHDLLTSRFAAGGRGLVLAALKQRSHSAPRRREVKVQLLDSGPLQTSSQDAPGLRTSSQDAPGLRTSSQDAPGVAGVQMEAGLSSGCPGDATNAATAAAALIKAQSDMEARVSHLAEGVQKLLQADREGGDREQRLSRQTLHHLETLHSQQLQLQSQLLESALRIVTGHASVTPTTSDAAVTSDLTASGQPPRLQVSHLDTAANVLSNQQRSSSATRAAAATVETGPVALATARRDRWPELTRDDRYSRGAPSVSTATQPAAGSHLQSSANHSQAAARRANEMLTEMGRLKSEMKTLLTPENSLKTTRPGPDHHQSQQNLIQSQQSHYQQNHSQSFQSKSQQNQSQSQQIQSQPSHFQSKSQQSQSQQTEPQQSQLQQSKSQQNQSQSKLVQSQQIPSQSHQSPFQQIQSQQNQTHQTQSQSVLVQRRPVVPSMLEEAGQVLRQVQRQKKVLEENLESLLRARTGEVLHCQLEALAANRDWAEEVRIKKTVDAWISTLTKDIRAEMSSEDAVRCRAADAATRHSASRDAAVTSQQRAAGSSAHTGRGRPVSALRGTGSKTVAGRGNRRQTAGHRQQGAEPDRVPGRLTDSERVVDGESYLTRLYGRAPYEGLRRTLKKSPYLRFSSPGSPLSRKSRPRLVESVRGVKVKSCKTQTCLAPPLGPSPGPPQHHYIIGSSHPTSGDPADLTVTPADNYSVPMAIPLGRRRMDSSRCLAERQQEVTSPPTAPPTSSVVAVDDAASELQSQEAEQLDAGEAPPPSRTGEIIERKSEEEEDEESVFPGTDFLSVADVVQQEVSVVGEEAVELDGGPSPPPVLYQGPVFPPQARSALPAQDRVSVPGLNLQRDALENRLVEWVEQQLMSRMISEMYRPPPSDPAQNDSTDQSEPEEQSVTSDIVEAAGGGGLQLFVDCNMSVDSALIRQLVNEVLTEHVALMLGHRDTLETGPEPGLEPPKPGPGAHQEEKLVPLVPTPVPTPPPSLTPPSRETPRLTTPPPSEPTSLLNEESPQPITAPEPVATPTSSPEPAHSAGSPPAVHQAPPPLTWGDAELPLDEERPEEHLDTHPQPLVMSVAEEEPRLSSPLPPPSVPPAPSPSPPPPGPDPGPAPPSGSSRDSSSCSSSSSSSTVTAETDAALKHISEGELLISVNQPAAMTEDEAVCSFSSSLQELQEMDFDPPSEGQVRGHDLLLTLLTKMEQGVTHTQRGERPQPEGSWGRDQEEEEVSVGEVRDHRTTEPHRTTNPKCHSESTAAQRGQTSSPGQISQCADVSEVSFEATNQGSVTVGDLTEPIGTLTSDLQTDLSLSPPPHLENTHTAGQVGPVLVRQYDRHTAGTRRMDVHLPSIRPEEEEQEEEEEEVSAADTDSSTSDVF